MVMGLLAMLVFAAEPEQDSSPETTADEGAETTADEGAMAEEEPAAPKVVEEVQPVAPAEVSDEQRAVLAEARRLTQELGQQAKNSRNEAVDRLYRQLLALQTDVDAEVHRMAADAALARGDVLHGVARLHRAGDAERLADVQARYGTVRLSVARAGLTVEGDQRFAPDETAAIAWANALLAANGQGVAMLPAGDYMVRGRPIHVVAGGSASVIVD